MPRSVAARKTIVVPSADAADTKRTPEPTRPSAPLARTATLEEVLDAAMALMPTADDCTAERDGGRDSLRALVAARGQALGS
ncbi:MULTISPECIES: hypothetical protein [Kitasatospora]|nr:MULTISPECIES: hypothetical protein [Kitasatospora]